VLEARTLSNDTPAPTATKSYYLATLGSWLVTSHIIACVFEKYTTYPIDDSYINFFSLNVSYRCWLAGALLAVAFIIGARGIASFRSGIREPS